MGGDPGAPAVFWLGQGLKSSRPSPAACSVCPAGVFTPLGPVPPSLSGSDGIQLTRQEAQQNDQVEKTLSSQRPRRISEEEPGTGKTHEGRGDRFVLFDSKRTQTAPFTSVSPAPGLTLRHARRSIRTGYLMNRCQIRTWFRRDMRTGSVLNRWCKGERHRLSVSMPFNISARGKKACREHTPG